MKSDPTYFENASNEELYALLKQGDESAYYQLFERLWEKLYSMAFKILKHKENAKDVVQEIFLSFWEKRATSQIENVEAYLIRSAKFAGLKLLRDDHFKGTEEVGEWTGLAQPQQDALEYQEFEEQVLTVIDQLPDRCKQVFKLSREQQLTNAEIAEKLNLSQRTVETHISNALKRLRKNLPNAKFMSFFLSLFI